MRDAVIVEAVRAPVGKRNGALSGIHPVELSAHVLRSLAERSGIDPAVVDDVVWAACRRPGSRRWTSRAPRCWPRAGLSRSPGHGGRQCGSSQQAVHFAAAGLIAGQYDVVVAGGVESMSRVPMGSSVQGQDPFGRRTWRVTTESSPTRAWRRDDRRTLGLFRHPARRVLPGQFTRRRPRPRTRAVSTLRSARSRCPTAAR